MGITKISTGSSFTNLNKSTSLLVGNDAYPGPAGTRGLWAGANATNRIDYFDIATTGNATTFGELTANKSGGSAGVSSRVRALFGGGYTSTVIKNIDYVTIMTTGNAVNFGDMSIENDIPGGLSNQIRGIFTRGYKSGSGPRANTMEYVTISTLGNTNSFGTIQSTRQSVGVASPTRGVFYIGFGNSNEYVNNIDYITIATTGNGTNWGTSGGPGGNMAACSNDTRAIFSGGFGPSGQDYIKSDIWYLTIASTGTASYFGGLLSARQDSGACSANGRGVIAGGRQPGAIQSMEYVTLATTGNSTYFGDMTVSRVQGPGASNGHGGVV
jgi:hypothetical protein